MLFLRGAPRFSCPVSLLLPSPLGTPRPSPLEVAGSRASACDVPAPWNPVCLIATWFFAVLRDPAPVPPCQ